MGSILDRLVFNSVYYRFHSLEDVAGMVDDHLVSFGEGANIITDLLVSRYFDNLDPFRIYHHCYGLMVKSGSPQDYFEKVFVFGKSLERLI